MKTIRNILTALAASFCRPIERLANEAAAPIADFFTFANQLSVDATGWVQLSPFGDFANQDSKGARVIQRFERADAEAIVNEFKSLSNLPQRLLGLPWYVGHPDHPRFKGQPGHSDSSAKGRIKQLEVREDGLYANVKFNSAGRQLVEDEAFHGHSVNWAALPSGTEGGAKIFRPFSLKSVGFTNQPQIPVQPAQLGNEEVANADDGKLTVPPKLKLIAGFAEDAECTMEEVIAALEKARGGAMANEKPPLFLVTEAEGTFTLALVNEGDGVELAELAQRFTTLANERAALVTKSEKVLADFANERKARATEFVAGLVKVGKILTADKDITIEALANTGDDYDTKAEALGKATPVVKTKAQTVGLAKPNAEILANERDRQVKLNEMMAKRATEFPNEDYSARFDAVLSTPEGQQLFAQMKRANSDE